MVAMEPSVGNALHARFQADAMETVKIKFVSDLDELNEDVSFPPEFVHQHFGESEIIFGYEDLNINIYYSSSSLFIYPEVTFVRDVKHVDKTVMPDDIVRKLKDQLPEGHLDCMVQSKEEFQAHLAKQNKIEPYGELLAKFSLESGEQMELYKVSTSSPQFDDFLARMQTLALWYIEGAQYTDNTDPRWCHYLLYEKCVSDEGDGKFVFRIAGYASVYNFYAYFDKERPRIAQILLFPQYRQCGLGAKLLQNIYKDIRLEKKVLDITVEDPSERCALLRDYVDCTNCKTLLAFTEEKLLNGFSTEMVDEALKIFKINKRQCRRVYEILRLYYLDAAKDDDVRSYRLDVKKRLSSLMDKSDCTKKRRFAIDSDWRSIDAEELNELKVNLDLPAKQQLLQTNYEQEVDAYKQVVSRMKTFPEI